MTRKKAVIIAVSIILVVAVIVIAIVVGQDQQPPKTETVNSQPLNGVSQNDQSTEGQEQNSDTTTLFIPEKRTNPEILASITSQVPSLLDTSSQPIFAIVSSIKTQNAWYVITIKNTKDATVGNAKIIMKDSGNQGGLVVIAGPGTKFDPEVIALPDEVQKLL